MLDSVKSRRGFLSGLLPFLGASVLVPALGSPAQAWWGIGWGVRALAGRRNGRQRAYGGRRVQPVAPRYVVPRTSVPPTYGPSYRPAPPVIR